MINLLFCEFCEFRFYTYYDDFLFKDFTVSWREFTVSQEYSIICIEGFTSKLLLLFVSASS